MTEFLGLLFVVWIFGLFFKKSKSSGSSLPQPTVMRSDGIEGHYDFLEMHGFVTPEENAERRRLSQELKEHPERFKTLTMQDLMDAQKRGSDD